jgi:DNA-binding CsgD family transcriptional regulator
MSASEKGPSESGREPGHSGEPIPGDGKCCPEHGVFCDEAWAGIAEKLGLSARQVAILRRILADQSEEEIAQALALSRDTVHTHMQRLHQKLHAHSRLQLATAVFGPCLVWHFESPPPSGCRLRRCHLRRRIDAL